MKTSISILLATLWLAPAHGQVSIHINSDATAHVKGGFEIVLKGNWENEGSFEPGEGKVTFNGAGNQNIANTGGETFYDIKVDKPSGVLNLQGDVTITNTLTMDQGDISSASNTLQIGESSEGTLDHTDGTVAGNFARYIESTAGSRLFPVGTFANHRPLIIDYTSAPASDGVITVSHTDPGGFSDDIFPLDDNGYTVDRHSAMYWTVNTSGISGETYDLSINGAGQLGILNSALLRVVHSTDGSSFDFIGTHTNGSGTIARRSGLNGNVFGRFYLGGNQVDNPLIESASVNKSVRNGWNLLALPFAVGNASYQTLFPNAVPGSLMGFKNGAYTTGDSLELREGYFLEFPSDETVGITGFPVENLTVDLVEDWNLISSGSSEVPISSIVDPGGIIIPGTIYGFDGAYFPAQTIQQGAAYWIRASGAGQITLPGESAPTQSSPALASAFPPPDMEQFTALRIHDAQGRRQTLYLNVDLEKVVTGETPVKAKVVNEGGKGLWQEAGNVREGAPNRERETSLNEDKVNIEDDKVRQVVKQRFSLPPAPPVGLDARFEGDLNISESDEALIYIRATDYPLTIDVSNLAGLLKSKQPMTDVEGDIPDTGISDLNEMAESPAANEKSFRYVITELVAGEEGQRTTLEEFATVVISDTRVKALKISKEIIEPKTFTVMQNYPNPFNPVTEIRYATAQDGKVEIVVYNILGQKIKTLVSQRQKAGNYSVVWDATNNAGTSVASGVYVYRVVSGAHKAVKKMILLK